MLYLIVLLPVSLCLCVITCMKRKSQSPTTTTPTSEALENKKESKHICCCCCWCFWRKKKTKSDWEQHKSGSEVEMVPVTLEKPGSAKTALPAEQIKQPAPPPPIVQQSLETTGDSKEKQQTETAPDESREKSPKPQKVKQESKKSPPAASTSDQHLSTKDGLTMFGVSELPSATEKDPVMERESATNRKTRPTTPGSKTVIGDDDPTIAVDNDNTAFPSLMIKTNNLAQKC